MSIRALFFVITIAFNFSAYACSCGYEEVEDAYKNSDFIFKGEVSSVSVYGPTYFYRVKFEISDLYKGINSDVEAIYTYQYESTCGYSFRENEKYIVFGYIGSIERIYTVNDKPMVSLCSLTVPLNGGSWPSPIRVKEIDEYLENVQKNS